MTKSKFNVGDKVVIRRSGSNYGKKAAVKRIDSYYSPDGYKTRRAYYVNASEYYYSYELNMDSAISKSNKKSTRRY